MLSSLAGIPACICSMLTNVLGSADRLDCTPCWSSFVAEMHLRVGLLCSHVVDVVGFQLCISVETACIEPNTK
jgi:hypothetical protein